MFKKLIMIELKSYFKDYVSCFFTFFVPIIIILTLGHSFGNYQNENGISEINNIIATTLVFLITNNGLMATSAIIGELKERETLKRYNSIGISLFKYFLIFLITQVIIVMISSIISIITAIIVFKPALTITLLNSLIISLILTIGLAIYIILSYIIVLLTNSVKSATMISSCLFMIMIFSSGVIIPLNQLPNQITNIVQYTPMYVLLDLIINLWNNTKAYINAFNINLLIIILYLILLIISLLLIEKYEKK